MLLPVIDAPARRRAAARALVTLACAMVPLSAACGKKGPPLAPLARLPVAPAPVSVSRAGDEVSIRFGVPNANVSGVRPADIERVDVYAWTGPTLTRDQVFKTAKVVASVPVRMPPPPPSDDEDAVPPPPPPAGPGVDQGALAELRETLDPDAFVPIELPASQKTAPERPPSGPDAVPLPPPLLRHYVVVGVNRGGRRGTPAAVAAVPLWPPPPPPLNVTAKSLEAATEVSWTAPEGLRRPVQERAIEAPSRGPRPSRGPAGARPGPPSPPGSEPPDDEPPAAEPPDDEPSVAEPPAGEQPATPGGAPGGTVPPEVTTAGEAGGLVPSRPLLPWPAPAAGYHVYEVAPDGGRSAVPRAEADPPPPPFPRRLTTAPLKETTFSDGRVEFGVERCYVVRTVETIGTLSVESEASARICVERADVFPPSPPKSVAAIASEGAISLIWEANTEADLAGYVVLRAVAPGAPAERLTPQPIRETTFRDTTVRPGTRYVYAVIAVDAARPANVSAPSNLVEETAR